MHKDAKKRVAHDVTPIEYAIDASGRPLGRVASEAAQALLGKKSSQFLKTKVLPITVTISNAEKLALAEKRVAQKIYLHYTGYPGGLRETSMINLIATKGVAEALRRAVDGMLPRNKLRKERMKRLIIKN